MKYSNPARVLLLGDRDCDHIRSVASAVERLGGSSVLLDSGQFPRDLSISYDPAGAVRFGHGDQQYTMADFRSVYWRSYNGVSPVWTGKKAIDRISRQDALSLMESLLHSEGPAWFNGYRAWAMHKHKPYQLRAVHHLGVPVPETLVTNNSAEARAFCQCHGDTIHKPVFGGSETRLVRQEHLDPERLDRVFASSPVTLQRYIPGHNLRTFVIGPSVFSVRIDADSIDFRLDPGHKVTWTETPRSVSISAREIARALHLNWTAIDWRVDTGGTAWFLEANPSPMFVGLAAKTGIDVAAQLAKALMQPDASPAPRK